MSDLRVMEIPVNTIGLGKGMWLRWGELRLWLVEAGQQNLADKIEETILKGGNVSVKMVTVRR